MNHLHLTLAFLLTIALFCNAMEQSLVKENTSTQAELPSAGLVHDQGITAFDFLRIACVKGELQTLAKYLKEQKLTLSPQERHDLLATTCLTDNNAVACVLWGFGFCFLEKLKYAELKIALAANNKKILQFFVEEDRSLDINRLFRDAIALQKDAIALWLTAQGASFTRWDHCRPHNSPLHIAAMCNPGFVDRIISNLEVDDAALTRQNVWGSTPLHCAAAVGQLAVVKRLLELKVPVDILDFFYSTPLFRAVRGGHVEVAGTLVDHNANLKHVNGHGYTVFTVPKDEHVTQEKHAKVIALLTQKQAEARSKQKYYAIVS